MKFLKWNKLTHISPISHYPITNFFVASYCLMLLGYVYYIHYTCFIQKTSKRLNWKFLTIIIIEMRQFKQNPLKFLFSAINEKMVATKATVKS